jgi:hypothetical protein
MKVNKFNASWQIVRLNVKAEKDVILKIKGVMDYYKANKTVSDLNRVLNWLRMTKLPYKVSPAKQAMFDNAIKQIVGDKPTKFDNDSNVDDLTVDETKRLLKDLKARKYDFQMRGKIPKDHVEFVELLEKD